jgi:hypothetical protein
VTVAALIFNDNAAVCQQAKIAEGDGLIRLHGQSNLALSERPYP